jgi:hypothetical protein
VSGVFIVLGLEIRKTIVREIAEKKKQIENQFNISDQLANKASFDVERIEKVYNKSLRNMWIIIISLALVNLYGYIYS